MRSTFKVLFYVKKGSEKPNGNLPLMCRITVDGKESRFNMKMDILPEHWDVKASKAMGRAKEVDEINSLIDNVKASLYQIYRDLQERGKQVTSEIIKNSFLGLDDSFETLLNLFDKHNERRSWHLLCSLWI